jgi:hypothetical protein
MSWNAMFYIKQQVSNCPPKGMYVGHITHQYETAPFSGVYHVDVIKHGQVEHIIINNVVAVEEVE